jgi:serine/threonine protein kinase
MLGKERWERVETLYHDALQRAPETRHAFLDQACEGDAEVRREVDSLLSFDGQAERFIETPAMEIAARALASGQSSASPPDSIKNIGPYQLVSQIGQGGSGDVYLAIDTRLDRKVALKLMSDDFAGDRDRISRFRQEARTTSTLSHPNIVTIFEIGEVDNRHYIATEYVEGETLRARLGAHVLELKETLSIVTQLIDALGAAHEAGIIHRDIKPENIIIRKDGLVKVLDFGIAKLTSPGANAHADHLTTRTGMVMGTAAYMSPEQARGQKVDHRTDIFSVGVLLYEILSGRKPFEGETWSDVMAAVLVKDAPRLDSAAPQVSPALRRIVERCLEKTPEKRFQSAGDLGFALREFASSSATQQVKAAETASLQAPPRRTNSQIVVAIVVLVLLGGAALLSWQPWAKQAPKPAAQAPKETRIGALTDTAPTTQLTWLDRTGNVLATMGDPGEYSGPALSPDEDRIVVALNDSQTKSRDLWILSRESHLRVRLTSNPGDDLNPLWTPDGRWIIYTSERNGVRSLYRVPANGTGSPEPLLVTTEDLNAEDVSRDGRFLVFNAREKRDSEPGLGLLSLIDRKRSLFASPATRAARFSPDRRWIAYEGSKDGALQIFVRGAGVNGEAAREHYLVSGLGKVVTTPMWRGDGQELFYLDGHTMVAVELQFADKRVIARQPRPLFNVNIEDQERRNRYLVTRDGQRFLVLVKK